VPSNEDLTGEVDEFDIPLGEEVMTEHDPNPVESLFAVARPRSPLKPKASPETLPAILPDFDAVPLSEFTPKPSVSVNRVQTSPISPPSDMEIIVLKSAAPGAQGVFFKQTDSVKKEKASLPKQGQKKDMKPNVKRSDAQDPSLPKKKDPRKGDEIIILDDDMEDVEPLGSRPKSTAQSPDDTRSHVKDAPVLGLSLVEENGSARIKPSQKSDLQEGKGQQATSPSNWIRGVYDAFVKRISPSPTGSQEMVIPDSDPETEPEPEKGYEAELGEVKEKDADGSDSDNSSDSSDHSLFDPDNQHSTLFSWSTRTPSRKKRKSSIFGSQMNSPPPQRSEVDPFDDVEDMEETWPRLPSEDPRSPVRSPVLSTNKRISPPRRVTITPVPDALEQLVKSRLSSPQKKTMLYSLLPLPVSRSELLEIWGSSALPASLIDKMLPDIPEAQLKPYVLEVPLPTQEPELNLSLIQAIHWSGSWAVPDEAFTQMRELEKMTAEDPKKRRKLNQPFSYASAVAASSRRRASADMEDELPRKVSAGLAKALAGAPPMPPTPVDKYVVGIAQYRHGTEIIRVGDLVRLVTAARQTRNLVVSPTHYTLLVTALLYSSEGSLSSSSRISWERTVYLEGEVCDAHVLDAGSWVTTGELRTVDASSVAGKWFGHYPKLAKKMPLVEQELWIGEGFREHQDDD
jgi:hypothetical protein